MSYDNNNRGAIWGNDKKEKDTHPDFKGSATIEGVEYWVSAWKRKPDANPNSPALSFTVKNKAELTKQGVQKVKQAVNPVYPDDDQIPF